MRKMILAALASAAAILAALAADALAEDYLPMKTGNSWTNNLSNGAVVTTTVTGFEQVKGVNCAVLESEMTLQGQSLLTTKAWMATDTDGIRVYKVKSPQAEIEFGKPPIQIKLPFKAGEKWQASLPLAQPVEAVMESVGQEKITVPAGTFSCIRIDSVTTVGENKITGSTWFADGVGQIQMTMTAPGGQQLTSQLVKTNVKPPVAAPPVAPPADSTAKVDTPKPAVGGPGVLTKSPTSGPALERYQSKDGRLLLYRPTGWKIEDGERFGPGTYAVSVADPQGDAAMMFITLPVKDEIKDSVQLAVAGLSSLQKTYPDLTVTDMKSTPDKGRTQAGIALTIGRSKALGHAYFFYTSRLSSIYFLLARADLWDQFRPTLIAITANLAYSPDGMDKVLKDAQAAADKSPAPDAGRNLSPAAMLQEAAKRPGKQLPTQEGLAQDGAFTIQLPQGWVVENSGILNWRVFSDHRTKEYGLGFSRTVISSINYGQAIPGVIYSPYLPPPQAMDFLIRRGGIGRDLKILAECSGDQLPAAATEIYRAMEANGSRVDLRVFSVQFTNIATGRAERGVYIVATLATPMTLGWEAWITGSYAPADEYDDYLPLYLRINNSMKIDQQWLANTTNAQQAESQRLQANLQHSICEAKEAGERYIESGREASRSHDYTSWAFSQSTLGQSDWVAENEGAKVYHTDSWGIEGAEGRVDHQAYNNTNFKGETPWGQNTTLVDTRQMWEKYIATPRQ